MEYYIEYIFLQEFVVDFLVLYFVGRLRCGGNSLKRVALGAFAGAVYSVVAYSIPMNYVKAFPVKFIVGELMITIAYNPKRFLDYIKITLCFYVFLWVAVSVFNILYAYFEIRAMIISLLLGFVAVFIVVAELRKKNINANYYRDVEIHLNGNKVSLKGFVDTGNELVDVLSNNPVAITELDNIREIFEENMYYEVLNACKKGDAGILDFMLIRMDNFNFRLLKYKTIDNKEKIMLGILPSKVIVRDGDKEVFVNCTIGISREEVSKSGEFQILLFKEVLNL